MSALTQLLSDLVAIDSTNPDLIPGAAGEAGIAHYIAGWLADRGLDVELLESAPGRPSVLATAHGTGGGKNLLLNGHMDTVGAGAYKDAHRPVIREGRLYGRGAYDMKGGLAACMQAIAAAHEQRLRGDVILMAVADEEYASLGTSELTHRFTQAGRTADGAIVAEFTELQLILAHKGFIWLDIETFGKAAHGSRPDLGVDAIAHMGRILVELERLNDALRANPAHPLLGSGSLHASLIKGGQELSSYPDHCTLSIERRTLPGESPEGVEAVIQGVVRYLENADPSLKTVVRRGLDRSPLETPEHADVARAIQTATTRVLGHPAQIAGVPFWTDAAILSSAGIPAVLFGPSGAGAHAVEEWVDLASVEACAQIYLAAILDFCS